jgi:DNA topoisomerase-1
MAPVAMVAREMGRKLVIVESPAKAKTIAGYLGPDFDVQSSIGHIRDLPNNASEIPAKFKDQPWSRLGVNVDNAFEPLYVVDSRKKKVVSDLKAKLKNSSRRCLCGGWCSTRSPARRSSAR